MTDVEDPVVLIIEDEREVAETYGETLDDEYAVRIATDGTEGLQKLDAEVDVVLLDRKMPGLSGDEVLTEIRARDVECRVVMVTAVDPDTDLLDLDFDEYLVKPVTGSDLKHAVERMLARDALEDHIQRMVTVTAKLATLETKLDTDQLAESEAYQDLLAEFESLRTEVDLPDPTRDYYSAATLEKLETLLENAQ